uniref:Uncharacterized protein n=1 Tax=Physcomitrium patens TaxID=3218 RepID=A0A2K1KQM8_PHYPA|nr:hypothetical protein PHYPA_006958 [Physcomitrium patens]
MDRSFVDSIRFLRNACLFLTSPEPRHRSCLGKSDGFVGDSASLSFFDKEAMLFDEACCNIFNGPFLILCP